MNQNILLAKIVPNATDTTWAQAYTTLNVYITLSIEAKNAPKSNVNSYGKELLEKLQREFFALDDKSLENIKKAVGNVSANIDSGFEFSILLGAIVNDILYIVIASKGQVLVKRDEKIGVIAKGEEGELSGFSGILKDNDTIIFETNDFSEKLPTDVLQEYLDQPDVLKISEDITPLIHEHSKGTEAAIILQYTNLENTKSKELPEDEYEEEKNIGANKKEDEIKAEDLWSPQIPENNNIEDLEESIITDELEHQKRSFPKLSFSFLNFKSKKTIIIIAIIILVVLLVGSIIYGNYRKNEAKLEASFEKIYNPANEKYKEGVGLLTLNKSEALDSFNQSEALLKNALPAFPKNSSQYKKLSDLQSQVESKINDIGGGSSAKNLKEFLKSDNSLLNISTVTVKGEQIIVGADKKVAVVDNSGKITKTFDTGVSSDLITADDKFIYVEGNGKIVRIDKGNKNISTVVKNFSGIALDSFGSNIYGLQNDDITKYKAPSYDASSYFAQKPTFSDTPIDMTISGPIYVLEKSGNLQSFTRGKNDNFKITGLEAPFSDNSRVYTDTDFKNIYIMDVKNQRVVVLNNNGQFQTQYEGNFIKNATSFAIDETNNKGYVVSGNVVYSFDL